MEVAVQYLGQTVTKYYPQMYLPTVNYAAKIVMR